MHVTADPADAAILKTPDAEPEEDMMVSVIATAVRDARGSTGCTDAERDDAIRWLRSDSEEPGSLRWYCDILGIDADGVRASLRRSEDWT